MGDNDVTMQADEEEVTANKEGGGRNWYMYSK